MKDAILVDAMLVDAMLIGAMQIDAMLVGTMLIGAMLVGTMLVDAMLIGAMLIDAMLIDAMRINVMHIDTTEAMVRFRRCSVACWRLDYNLLKKREYRDICKASNTDIPLYHSDSLVCLLLFIHQSDGRGCRGCTRPDSPIDPSEVSSFGQAPHPTACLVTADQSAAGITCRSFTLFVETTVR